MKVRAHYPLCKAVSMLVIVGAVAAVVALMSPAGLEAQTPKQQHEAIQNQIFNHDNDQLAQHIAQDATNTGWHRTLQQEHLGQSQSASAHDSAQATEHNALSGKLIHHDSAQATEHKALMEKIPIWDKTLPANDPGGPCPSSSSRFTCVMGGAAVRDNETGLVWEQSPATTPHPWTFTTTTLFHARIVCATKSVGGRMGWRLPSFAELASLVDPSVPRTGPTLPADHPFSNVQFEYWSATTDADVPFGRPGLAWAVNFAIGTVFSEQTDRPIFVWCVRGAMNAHQY